MKTYEYLIIGGGIAGVTAAETIRGKDASSRIGIISSEPHLLYSRVLLPSYIKGRIARERVFLRKEEDFARLRIDFMRGCAAAGVDTAARRVLLTDGEELAYEKLLIATGGSVRPWPVMPMSWRHGEAGESIFRLQTLDDADRIVGAMDTIRQPLVIGSSFIALELIEIFILHGVAPRVLVRGPHFFDTMIDGEGAVLIEENMAQRGASLVRGDESARMEYNGAIAKIWMRGGSVFDADAVGIGIGIARNTGFLASSGIVCGRGVRTDEFLETNIPGVFAAGDVAEYFDSQADRHTMVGNWTHAVRLGRRAGLNMTGEKISFSDVPSYSITNLGLHIAALGECNGGLETVSRSDGATRQYERFFMRDGTLVGAFLINRAMDRPILMELIGRRAVIAPYAARLRDMAFDIHSILP